MGSQAQVRGEEVDALYCRRFMIAALGGLAHAEGDLIRTRVGEERARARLRGQRMGRPPKMIAAQKREARRRRGGGQAAATLARCYGVGSAAIRRTTGQGRGQLSRELDADTTRP